MQLASSTGALDQGYHIREIVNSHSVDSFSKNVTFSTQILTFCTFTVSVNQLQCQAGDWVKAFVSIEPLDVFKETSGNNVQLYLWQTKQVF